ncbi:uncharacterized protein [Clytia hemisphaerica]|uniref:Uncharacterized protein n=1 Tax=Clytia hemisphaerica TaxID=252671 RepID=A0A7M5WTW4_9CNID
MRDAVRMILVALSLSSFCTSTVYERCGQEFDVIGCFTQTTKAERFNKTLSHVDWWRYDHKSFEMLLCKCSAKAREKGYIAFTFHDYVECHGTDDYKEYTDLITNEDRASDECINEEYELCDNGQKYCMGGPYEQYIYKLNYTGSGIFTQWSSFGNCSKPCGGGIQYRTRVCASGGNDCVGSTREERECNMEKCPPPPLTPIPPKTCRWGNWTKYSSCSQSCGEGFQKRTRKCDDGPQVPGGEQCVAESEQIESCFVRDCPDVNHWGPWSSYTTCSKTCDEGKKSRKRVCIQANPPNKDKSKDTCHGDQMEYTTCNLRLCLMKPTCYHKYTPWSLDESGNPEALSYHKIHCADWHVLNRVRLDRNMFKNRYRYYYRCCHSQLPCDDSQTKNKPTLNNGTMVSLDQQPVHCGKFGVSYLKLNTIMDKKQYLSYTFECCRPRNELAGTICYKGNTGFKKRKALDEHSISCTKDDRYFIANFNLKINHTQDSVRYDYECCRIDPTVKNF